MDCATVDLFPDSKREALVVACKPMFLGMQQPKSPAYERYMKLKKAKAA